MHPLLLFLMVATTLSAGAAQMADWSSSPARPNATVLVAGSGLQQLLYVSVVGGATRKPLQNAHAEPNALRFTLPPSADDQLRAFDITNERNETILRGGLPEPWWWLGDRGAASTAGGWLRVVGRSLTGGATTTKLRLMTHTGSTTTLEASHASAYDANFKLPARLDAGDYSASLSNGLRDEALPHAWTALSMFLDADRPRHSTIRVLPALVSPTPVFRAQGVDCGTPYADSTDCIRDALRKAAMTASGSVEAVVLLPQGRYYVNASYVGLAIPPNVALKGEGHDLTAIYFVEDSNMCVALTCLKHCCAAC